jgi:hypothetical protein
MVLEFQTGTIGIIDWFSVVFFCYIYMKQDTSKLSDVGRGGPTLVSVKKERKRKPLVSEISLYKLYSAKLCKGSRLFSGHAWPCRWLAIQK